jgi:hypothetical protein
MSWIKLLSPKELLQFQPSEFKEYVRSLKGEPKRRTPTIKIKPPKPPFVWKITKTGKISVKVNREPKWLSREEIAQITLEEQDKIITTLSEIPW